jgi:hypothetical protein
VNSLNIGGRSETSKAGSGSGGFILIPPHAAFSKFFVITNSVPRAFKM